MLPLAYVDDAANIATRGLSGADFLGIGSIVAGLAGESIRGWGRTDIAPVYKHAAAARWGLVGRTPVVGSILRWNTERKMYRAWENRAAAKVLSNYGAARVGGAGRWAAAKGAFAGVSRSALLAKAGSTLVSAGNIAFLAPLALEGGRAIASGLAAIGKDYSRPDWGTPFMDTEQAYTQRQAGLAAIHNSQLQTRSFFMREAQAFHR